LKRLNKNLYPFEHEGKSRQILHVARASRRIVIIIASSEEIADNSIE